MQKLCAFCKRLFTIRYRSNPNTYCSISCRSKGKIIRIDIICDSCGNHFLRKPCEIKNSANFCNKSCSGKVNRGKYTITKEHIEKIRKTALLKGFGKWMKGRKGNKGTFKKGQFAKDRHPFWKGGITPERGTAYQSDEYKEWRKAVFERDAFRCQWCGLLGVEIQADHIFPWALHPSKRYDLNNGRTLCVDCHKERTSKQLKIMWKNQISQSKYRDAISAK